MTAAAGAGVRADHQRRGARAGGGRVDVLQLDEPAFNVYMDDVAAWGIEALHRAIDGLSAAPPPSTSATATGSRPTSTGSRRWAGEWRQYEQTFPLLAQSRIDQVSLECANSRVPLSLLGLLAGKDVLVGCHRRRLPPPSRPPCRGRGDDPARPRVRARRSLVPVHQLRAPRSPAPGRRPRQAACARRRRPPRATRTRTCRPSSLSRRSCARVADAR